VLQHIPRLNLAQPPHLAKHFFQPNYFHINTHRSSKRTLPLAMAGLLSTAGLFVVVLSAFVGYIYL
jgi:hypothetical protein